MDTSPTQAQPLPPARCSSPPGCQAFVPARQGPASLPLNLEQAPRELYKGRDPIRSPYPLLTHVLSPPEEPQVGSKKPTICPSYFSGSGGPLEGKVHFVNQPIVGLPSAGSSSPDVSLGAVDTDVNCQGCPPPSNSLLGHPAGPAQGPLLQCSPLAPCKNHGLPHLRNCQHLTGYFIMWIGHGGCRRHQHGWQILDCLPGDKSQLNETCRLHSICSTSLLPPSRPKWQVAASWGPFPGWKNEATFPRSRHILAQKTA